MFIPRKCLHSNPPPQLFVGDTVLTSVDTVKYLGVSLSSDMSWSPHINKINAKTRKLIGLFYRHFYFYTFYTCHTLYIFHSSLSGICVCCLGSLCKDIDLLDKTQTFAFRVCLKNWSLSSDLLHRQLDLPSLADRRRISKLCHLYKIIKNLEDFCS